MITKPIYDTVWII